MAVLQIVDGLTYDGRPYAEVPLPHDWTHEQLQKSRMSLEADGITLRPGYIEKQKSHSWYVEGGVNRDALRAAITRAFPVEEITIEFYDDGLKPPVLNDPISAKAYERAPKVYENSSKISGGLLFVSAFGLLKSALHDEELMAEKEGGGTSKRWLKRGSAFGYMISSAITAAYGDEPANQQGIHDILADIKDRYNEKDFPDIHKALDEKQSPIERVHHYVRRLPWAVSGLFTLAASTLRLTELVFSKDRVKGDITELLTSMVLVAGNIIRVFVPQHGGQNIVSTEKIGKWLEDNVPATKQATESLRDKVSELPGGVAVLEGLQTVADRIQDAPLKVNSDLSMLGQVGNAITAVQKKDAGLGFRVATVIGGNMFKRITNKKLGVGFDKVVSTATNFIENWDYPNADIEQKIALVSRELSRRPEIFHTADDIAQGIVARLLYRHIGSKLGEVEPDPSPSRYAVIQNIATPYLPRERWVQDMPLNLLDADSAIQNQPKNGRG